MSVSKRLIKKLKLQTSKIKRKDMKVNVFTYKTGTLLAKRNRSIAIMEAVARNTYVVIEYVKITTNELKTYKIIPLEWKFRELKVGRRKVLYAQDMNEQFRTKSFVHVNIQRVMIGRKKELSVKYPQKILRTDLDLRYAKKEKV